MKSSFEILHEMSEVLDKESFSKASVLLLDSSHRLVGGAPTLEMINSLLPLLRVRQQISAETGKKIYGLAQTIQVLSELDEHLMILGFGFTSSSVSGKFYYLEIEDKPLGATIVDWERVIPI